MASEEDKQRQRARFGKQIRHLVDHDEAQRRKREAKARRGGPRDEPPRRRAIDDDDEAGFEKMRRRAPVGGQQARPVDADLPLAAVAGVHRSHVELDDGRPARIAAHLLLDSGFALAVGDRVRVATTDDAVRIVAVEPRRSCITRPDPGNAHRRLVLAANVDVAVIVVAAADPPLRPGLVDRFLLALADGGTAPLVVVNKCDLVDGAGAPVDLDATLAPYAEIGVAVLRCSAIANDGIAALRSALAGKTCVFVGHSGVGKSSLLNALDPGGERRIGAVREYDGRGRHTTTSSSMRTLSDGTRIVDTPGIRAFGLGEIAPDALRAAFADFASFARRCRFRDCSHRDEPDCAVRAAAASGELSAARYASYLRILASD